MTFENKIIAATDKLNTNEKEVLEWMYQHRDQLLNYSIYQISKEVHLSKSFISKLIKKIGYSSFAEFKLTLAAEVASEASDSVISSLDLQEKDLTETKRLLKQVNFSKLFDDFSRSNFVYCYGTGHTTNNYIKELSRNLMSIGNKRVISLSGKSELESMVPLMVAGDCFFVASRTGESKELLDLLQILRLKKVLIISITVFSNSSLVRLADYNLFYYSTTIFNQISKNRLYSFLPLNLCIDTLIRNYLDYLQENS